MTDKRQADIERGQRAERLLGDELLNECFAKLEAEYVQAWKTWAAHDTAGRERLWMAVNIVGLVKTNLNSIAAGGKLAKKELDELAGKPKGWLA